MIFENILSWASSAIKSGQVRPIAKRAPHLHKIFAIVFLVTYFVKDVHIIDPKYLRVHI